MKKVLSGNQTVPSDILAVLEAIYERRAVRKYKDQPINKTLIEKILDAGRMAPSAVNKQPWKFYILTNKDMIHSFSKEIKKAMEKNFIKTGPKAMIKTFVNLLHFPQGLWTLKNADPIFHGAPVVIFITASKDNEWAALDIGMCAQNMMLAAKAFGLDTCPVGLGKYVVKAKDFPLLHIPESEQVHIALILGYGDETPQLHQRTTNNVFYIS